MDLLGELSQSLDEGQLLGGVQHSGVHIPGLGHLSALLSQTGNEGADAGVGVLDIVHGVLAVLPHRQIQVEVQGAGRGPGVEEVPGGVHADLVQQVVQGDGLAGTLGHTHRLAVLHQVDQLHQHHHQAV